VFNSASKLAVGTAVLCALAGLVHVGLTGDRSGYVLLVAAAGALGVVTVANVVYAAPPPFSAITAPEADGHLPTDTTDVARRSPWPLVSALAVGLIAVGMAAGEGLIIVGVVALALTALAWLAQAWQEHPAWTDAMTLRLNERIVIPFVLPATVVALIAVAVVSFSRVLLAVSATAAWIIALVAAAAILASLAWLSTREQIGAPALKLLGAFAAVLTVATGVLGVTAGEREFHPHADELSIVAKNNAFNLPRLRVAAGSEVTVTLDNRDAGILHTFSVYTRAGGDSIFVGEEIAGVQSVENSFDAPAAEGRYYFQCDVHPQLMFGVFAVEAAEAGEGADATDDGETTGEEDH
jgi:plastocyanin